MLHEKQTCDTTDDAKSKVPMEHSMEQGIPIVQVTDTDACKKEEVHDRQTKDEESSEAQQQQQNVEAEERKIAEEEETKRLEEDAALAVEFEKEEKRGLQKRRKSALSDVVSQLLIGKISASSGDADDPSGKKSNGEDDSEGEEDHKKSQKSVSLEEDSDKPAKNVYKDANTEKYNENLTTDPSIFENRPERSHSLCLPDDPNERKPSNASTSTFEADEKKPNASFYSTKEKKKEKKNPWIYTVVGVEVDMSDCICILTSVHYLLS